jgi:ABC-type transporter Mla subunit MlaD
MAHDGKTQRDTATRTPAQGNIERLEPREHTLSMHGSGAEDGPSRKDPKLPGLNGEGAGERKSADAGGDPAHPKFNSVAHLEAARKPAGPPPPPLRLGGGAQQAAAAAKQEVPEPQAEGVRRPAKRRAAGPARTRVAANDDAPSIGGLIFALQQKPSNRSFMMAAAASGGWFAVGGLLAWAMLAPEIARNGFTAALSSPTMIIVAATVCLPILLFWFLALLVWRAQELKLMSSAMTEVAVRLAEPDRAAEQSAASLGQAVRRQVSFMNEAISRALGRAGELEALVHNEVSELEKSYNNNEHKIRGLIQELAGERHALVSTTDKVADTLKSMGSEVPTLIDKLSQQQIKLAKIIEGAGQNLIALENQLSGASTNLESALSNRTQQLQAVLDDYTVALDSTLASRAEALDIQLVERSRALESAFAERLNRFDETMLHSTVAIDRAVSEKARALTVALENHVRALSDTLGQQASHLDESMMHGLDAVRRTSDSITRQSLKAIEGLSGQADLLKNVSENVLHQITGVTSKFDNQGQSIMMAASALETANKQIDSTLQNRHAELAETLQRLSGKADQLDQVMRGYSQAVEGNMVSAEARALALAEQIKHGTAAHSQAALAELDRLRAQTDEQSQAVVAELERLRTQTDLHATRAIEDMRSKVTGVSQEVSQHLGSIASRFNETSEDLRSRAARAAADLQIEQERMRADAERLPIAARESAEVMRASLNDQLRALEQLSSLSQRERRDVVPPAPVPPARQVSLTAAFAAQRGATQLPAPSGAPAEGWSLTDLLSRASREDSAINIASIARALDPTTASAIWSRFRAGQRGIMVRSIYTPEGRTTFDDLSRRYKTDADFHRVVDRFLAEFEWLIRDIEQKDTSGRSVHNHLISDSGRVYLFLAHASGRLR